MAFIAQTVYPTGTSNPSAITAPCKIYRGWPQPDSLDNDLAAGTVNISVFPMDVEKRTTRFLTNWQPLPLAAVNLTLTAAGTTVIVGGSASSPLNVGIIVNGQAALYAVQASDTLTSIATALATLVNDITPATSSGPVITIPGANSLAARVGAVGSVLNEVRRQKRNFMVACWCATPTLRDTTASLVDSAFAAIDYLTLPDGTGGRILYERSPVEDRVEKERLYRRTLIYSVEYGTTQTQTTAQILTELFNLTGGFDPNAPLLESFNI